MINSKIYEQTNADKICNDIATAMGIAAEHPRGNICPTGVFILSEPKPKYKKNDIGINVVFFV
ncbi:MAG: hypothetical protein FWC98_00575 [Bacteroidales bacterium]|nr:hypothetical protein [Bacteroidales bacterium]